MDAVNETALVAVNISIKASYAVRTVFYLALRAGQGKPARIVEISRATGIPANYLAHLLPELKKAGFVHSRRGAEGGYILVREPSAIPVMDVIESVQGDTPGAPCSNAGGSSACPMGADCALERLWHRLNDAQREMLRSVTYEDLVQQQNRISRGNYTI